VYLGRFLKSIRGIFRPIIPVGNSVDIPIGKGVLVPLVSVIILLVIVNNVYKHIFI
jgi:hypothetical protein